MTTYALSSSPTVIHTILSFSDGLILAHMEPIKPPSAPVDQSSPDATLVNKKTSLNYVRVCNSPPLFPISNPADFNEAKRKMLHARRAIEPVVWCSEQRWTYGSCGIFLLPNMRERIVRDTFSRLDIARDASGAVMECVTQLHGFRGRSIPVGEGWWCWVRRRWERGGRVRWGFT